MLFVGLKTGFMPSRGGRISKVDEPFSFWFIFALCSAVLVVFVGGTTMVLKDGISALAQSRH
jgi:hypothetical protein